MSKTFVPKGRQPQKGKSRERTPCVYTTERVAGLCSCISQLPVPGTINMIEAEIKMLGDKSPLKPNQFEDRLEKLQELRRTSSDCLTKAGSLREGMYPGLGFSKVTYQQSEHAELSFLA